MADVTTILALFGDEEETGAARAALADRGFEVTSAPSVFAAIAAFTKKSTDVLLVDMDAVEERDLEFIEIARSQHPEVFVLAVFSLKMRERALEALKRGADASLLKPFYPGELCALLVRARERMAGVVAAPGSQATAAERAEELSKIALGVAHEVNNPLATISGHVEMLASDGKRTAKDRRLFASLKEEVDRIAAVVRELTAFAEQAAPKRTPVQMNDLVAEALDAACDEHRRSEGEPDGVEVVRSLRDNLPPVSGDKRQLLQLWHLLLEYMRPGKKRGGRLEVQTYANGADYVAAVLCDPERVIPPDRVARLCDPFGVTSEEDDSAGLTLAICRGIVARHGGKLSVESEPGKGTRFTLSLPAHRAESEDAEATSQL